MRDPPDLAVDALALDGLFSLFDLVLSMIAELRRIFALLLIRVFELLIGLTDALPFICTA